jgi:undecaprenyl phosphate-alpha-L-ara4FN deformylase
MNRHAFDQLQIADYRYASRGLAAHLLKPTADARRDHVCTLHAELEGQKLAPIFEQLLSSWRTQGYQLASMADYYEKMKHLPLPAYPASWGNVPGRSGELIVLDTTL